MNEIDRASDAAESEERRLVCDVLARDRKATAAFVARCADWVYPFVRSRLMPRTELVEDLVQEIMLAAWQALPGFRGDSRLRTWILGIARHKVEDHYRKCLRNLELSDDEEAIDEQVLPIPSKEIESVEQKEQVGRTLAALPEAYAVALIWRYRDEKSVREMAQLSGKTEKAMERLLARARENFRRRWHDA